MSKQFHRHLSSDQSTKIAKQKNRQRNKNNSPYTYINTHTRAREFYSNTITKMKECVGVLVGLCVKKEKILETAFCA